MEVAQLGGVYMKYLQACKKFLLEKETFMFVKEQDIGRPYWIDVPFYLWQFLDKSDTEYTTDVVQTQDGLQSVASIRRKVYNISLNGIDIAFADKYSDVIIKFRDNEKDIECRIVVNGYSIEQSGNVSGVDYSVSVNGVQEDIESKFESEPLGDFRFLKVPHLGLRDLQRFGRNKLCAGLSPSQFEVYYKGFRLGGTCYAYICGTWAILLDDDMTFDTLVLLSSISSIKLDVDRFVYTVNPYVERLKGYV